MPFPARDLLSIAKYGQRLINFPTITIMATRGCPYNCVFCSTNLVWGKKHQTRSPQIVCEEIKEILKKYNLKSVFFFDDTLTVNKKYVYQLLNEFAKNKLNFH